MQDSKYTYKGDKTFRIELGDVGILLGKADQEDQFKIVALDVNGTLKTVSSAIGWKAIDEGDTGGQWEVIPYPDNRVQLKKLS